MREHLASAEISDIRVENINETEKPLVYQYHIRVPSYAERTGKRLFLQPAFFERGVSPLFPNSARKTDVYFHYPWSEDDYVEIELPAGFALDNPDAPAPFKAGAIAEYKVSLGITKDGRMLVYKRNFFFDGLLIPSQKYEALKQVFDLLNKQDNHTITLKLGSATATNAGGAAGSTTSKNQ